MITKEELINIVNEVFRELNIHDWQVFYASAEPEVLFSRQSKPGTAINLEYKLTDRKGHFITTYLRLESNNHTDIISRNNWIRASLKSRLEKLLTEF